MKALLNAFSQMVSIISINVNKTKLPTTKGFTIEHCRLWKMVHGGNLNWNRRIKMLLVRARGFVALRYVIFTGKNNGFPFLNIGYLKNTTKIPNMEEWDKSQSGNLVGNSLVGTCLTLPNLGFLWVFFKYPKISKNGNPLFFPVILKFLRLNLLLWVYELANSFYLFRVYIFWTG